MATDQHDDAPRPRKGVSLAKGPVGLVGLASLVFGILGFIFASRSFDLHAPSGTVMGTTFLGIEGNGWTWVVFALAGLLLLLGSTVHWGAKSMAFIVGVVFVVGALIALSDGDDIMGVAAMNGWTTLVMGVAGVGLIALSMLPRVSRRHAATTIEAQREQARTGRFDRDREREPMPPPPETTTTTPTHHTPKDRR